MFLAMTIGTAVEKKTTDWIKIPLLAFGIIIKQASFICFGFGKKAYYCTYLIPERKLNSLWLERWPSSH